MSFIAPLPLTYTSHGVRDPVRRRPRVFRVSRPPLARARCTSANPPESPPPVPPTTPTPSHHSPKLRLVLTLLALILIAVPLLPLLTPTITYLTNLSTTLPPFRAASLIGFINYFTVLFCFPANMAFMIAAGALLGPLPAFLALFSSKLLASATAFVVARRLLTKQVESMLENRPRLSRILKDSNTGWRFVLLMRLSPFPGFMLNYLLSITDVAFWEYLFGTFVGIFPSVLNLVLVGNAARHVGMGIGFSTRGGWLASAIRLACAVSMVLVTVLITRKVSRVFREYDDGVDVAELKS